MFKHVPLWSSLGSGRGGPDLWQARPPCTFVLVFLFFGWALLDDFFLLVFHLCLAAAFSLLFLVGFASNLVVFGG